MRQLDHAIDGEAIWKAAHAEMSCHEAVMATLPLLGVAASYSMLIAIILEISQVA